MFVVLISLGLITSCPVIACVAVLLLFATTPLFCSSRFMFAGGLVAEHEPRLDGVDRSRPDLAMYLDNQLVFTDVSVCHPTAPSLLSHASRPLGAAQVRVGQAQAVR